VTARTIPVTAIFETSPIYLKVVRQKSRYHLEAIYTSLFIASSVRQLTVKEVPSRMSPREEK
jgi:hypothetical protein